MRRLLPSVVAAIIGCILLAGCGPSGPQRVMAKVKGKVVYEGKPVAKGNVVFQSANGAPGVGVIKEGGTYELQTGVGPNKITIHSRDPNTTDPKSGMPSEGKSHIPTKYEFTNSSGLTMDVQPNKENTLDFNLTK